MRKLRFKEMDPVQSSGFDPQYYKES
jgi:hypothetical protein